MKSVNSMSGIGSRPWRKTPWVVMATSAAYLPASAPNMSRPAPKMTSAVANAAAADGITAVTCVTWPNGHETSAISQAKRSGLLW